MNRDAFGPPDLTAELREDRQVLQHALSSLLDALEGMGFRSPGRIRAVAEARAVLADSVAILDERPCAGGGA